MADLCVVALGGNALIDPALPPTVENQFAVTAEAVAPIAELIEHGTSLVLTHGNGPQVGFMQLRSELAKKEIHEVPLDSLVADTQGAIGYMIARGLRGELERRGSKREVVAVVTQVEVDPKLETLEATKPIGKFYSAAEADMLRRERGWEQRDDAHRGFRRHVRSPEPVRIVELEPIRQLLSAGVTVIACGGGGIPVRRAAAGQIQGLEAVVDKDYSSALLAADLGASRLIITTGVEGVYRDFMTDKQTMLTDTNTAELKALEEAGHFAPGSMRPKIDAAIYFLERCGEQVVICEPTALVDAFHGRAGTRITQQEQ